jgi:hypothetical protein
MMKMRRASLQVNFGVSVWSQARKNAGIFSTR